MKKNIECKGGLNGDCPRPHYARGYCNPHFQAFNRGLPTDYDVESKSKHNAITECTVEGCNKPNKALGLCVNHYSQQRRKIKKETA